MGECVGGDRGSADSMIREGGIETCVWGGVGRCRIEDKFFMREGGETKNKLKGLFAMNMGEEG